MSKSEPKQPALRHCRLRVADLNAHLMCVLCGGYYVDATTIIECLHSFCKSCLVKYLETNKYCPICEVQVHKTRPLQNIRSDETLQNMVYKLVPGLYHKEMKCRQEFYTSHLDAPESSPEDRGVIDPIECQYYSPEEYVSLALEFQGSSSGDNSNGAYRRYLRCPAAVTVAHLQKLVRNKFSLATNHEVQVLFSDKPLLPELSIMDVAYSFGQKRKGQFHFTYRIADAGCKRIRLELPAPATEKSEPMEVDTSTPTLVPQTTCAPAQPPESKSKLDSIISRLGIAKQTEQAVKAEKTEEWKEVQLQISENGIMSVTGISSLDKLINTVEKNISSVENSSSCLTSRPEEKPVPERQRVTGVKEETPEISCLSMKSTAVEPRRGESPGVKTAGVEPQGVKPLNVKPSEATPVDVKPPVVKTPDVKTSGVKPSEVKPPVTQTVKNSGETENSQRKPTPNMDTSAPKSSSVKSADSSLSAKTPATVPSDNKVSTPTATSSSEKTNVKATVSQASSIPTSSAASNMTTWTAPCTLSSSSSSSSSSSTITSKSSKSVTVTAPCVSTPPVTAVKTTSAPLQPPSIRTAPTTTTTTTRAAPVPAITAAPSTKKSSSSPVGYKTLKCGPKNWNPSISRNSFLSSKMEQQQQQHLQQQQHQPQQQNQSPGSPATSSSGSKPSTPTAPRFFKMRNTPRYLGNPASGVKAMYQVPESKPETPPPAKTPSTPSVMKVDPRTLTPIVSNSANSLPTPTPTPKSPSSQSKGRLPFPSTTLSAQVNNHMSSSRSVTTTTTTSTASKMSELPSLRNSLPQPLVNQFLSMPNFVYGALPGLLPASPSQYANLLRPPHGIGFPPVPVPVPVPVPGSGYHSSMFYNSHQLHRQLNSPTSSNPPAFPLSPTSSSSPSLPLSPSSKSSTPAVQRIPASNHKPVNSSHQVSNQRTSGSLSVTGSTDTSKVNGRESPRFGISSKSKAPSQQAHATSTNKTSNSSKDIPKSKLTNNIDNNNTSPVSKPKVQAQKTDGEKKQHNISNLLPKEAGKSSEDKVVSKATGATAAQT